MIYIYDIYIYTLYIYIVCIYILSTIYIYIRIFMKINSIVLEYNILNYIAYYKYKNIYIYTHYHII